MSSRTDPGHGYEPSEYDADTTRTHYDMDQDTGLAGRTSDDPVYDEERRRERFGGTNWGSAFFGWLVAVGVAILLTGIVGAAAAAAGSSVEITQSNAEQQAGTIGLVAAAVLLVMLMIAYYAGGYVAGRMSRFDGGKQGVAVWVIGLVITLVAVGLGVVFGTQYNILDRVDLPTVPIPTDTLTVGGAIAAVVALFCTLLAAMAGGKVGRHYHSRVDAAGYTG